MALVIIEIEEHRIADLQKQLGYIRCWVDGFQAAGKQGPHAIDALRQVQLVLKSAKPKTSKKARA
jgi:hypothetical protein